jgi:hypothetical protein
MGWENQKAGRRIQRCEFEAKEVRGSVFSYRRRVPRHANSQGVNEVTEAELALRQGAVRARRKPTISLRYSNGHMFRIATRAW